MFANVVLITLGYLLCEIYASFPAQIKTRRDYVSNELLAPRQVVSNLDNGDYVKALSDLDAKLNKVENKDKLLRKADIYILKATAYSRQSKYSYAMEALNIALGIKNDRLGAQSYGVAAVYNNIASVFADRAAHNPAREKSDRDSAIEFYTKALNIFIQEPVISRGQPAATDAQKSSRNITMAHCYHNMATVYQEKGQYKEAIFNYGRALYIQMNTKGVGPWSHLQAETYYYLGTAYDEQNIFDKGLENAVKASKIDLQIGGIDTAKLDLVTYGLIIYRKNQGRQSESVSYLITTLNKKIHKLGWNALSTGVTYMQLGGAFEETKNYSKALEFYQNAHEAFVGHMTVDHYKGERHAFDDAHVLLMDVYNKIGLCYERRGWLDKATIYMDYAVNMTKGIHISDDSSHWNRSAASRAFVYGKRYTGLDAYDTASMSGYAANIYSNQAHILNAQSSWDAAAAKLDLSTSIRLQELQASVNPHSAIAWNYFLKGRNQVSKVNLCDADANNYLTNAKTMFSETVGPRHLESQRVWKEMTSNSC